MKNLILYSTVGCHLCEQALAIIMPLIQGEYLITEVDISESDLLMARYGVRIPVILREDSGAEIGWPFDQQAFVDFLR
ncbi:glutaredoxin family protein [Oceanicoccus sp. KOV_DT_Chl]|uniref:glutaredoxin family protein n=1 Tax=Oceanicoccus sp. KOV_DT_Chl TaxID=1904639 RepID=UPI000C7AE298|nr:glutaredoxin family protein [Oceanicoccus sp. KOV_DT_Chl]